MKKILIPTDFSNHSRNAAFYAVELAKQLRAHLVLYHAYSVPSAITSPPVYSYSFPDKSKLMEEVDKIETSNFVRLKFFRDTILKGKRNPCCSIVQQRAFVNEGITQYATNHDNDLIVMGTRGSQQAGDMLISNITWGVIQKSKVPVLAIPEGCKYQKIKHICFINNIREDDAALIQKLSGYAEMFNARLSVVHISNKPGNHEEQKFFDSHSKDHFRKTGNENLDFKMLEHKDVSVALAEYLKDTNVDLLAMSYEKRELFDQLFDQSFNRMFARHADVPLLAFPS